MDTKKIIVSITGASGAIYAFRLLKQLRDLGVEIHLIATPSGSLVFEQELNISLGKDVEETKSILVNLLECNTGQIQCYDSRNPGAKVASGSAKNDGMVIIPCSMSMLAAISNGLASDLTARAASVMLKERRPLILVPRETPLNGIHIKNMMALHEAGAVILPAMPGFYNEPKSIEDLADFVVGRVLDILHLEHETYRRWEGLDMHID